MFHVHPVAHIEEGVEILTGIEAGSRDGRGQFPQGTVFRRVDERLQKMAETLKQFE
jgi:hypothetical protein